MKENEKVLDTIDVNSVFEDINKIEVPLEIQTGCNGSYLDTKFVECDKAADKLEKWFTKVSRELTNYEIRYSVVEEEIANKKRNELTNNTEILKKYNTGRERENAVEMLLTNSLAELNKLNRKILALKNLLGVIKTKQTIIGQKVRNLIGQASRMKDLVRFGGVTSPQDKDTIDLMHKLGDIEKLEETLDAKDVEEAQEFIEQDPDGDALESGVTQKTSDSEDQIGGLVEIDVSVESTESIPSPVTQKEPEIITESSDEVVIDSDKGNPESVSKNSPVSESEVAEPTESDPSEEGVAIDELDMDTVLDGLDPEGESESAVTEEVKNPEVLDLKVPTKTADEGDENLVLEDIFSGDDAVVTDEPAPKKSGQGEPTSKEKSPKKEVSQASAPPVKETEDVATTGDVDIDNILDSL
jgi:hypothetical protein